MRIGFVLCAFAIAAVAAHAEDWPGWRGPRGDGTSLEKDVPTHWSKTENILWKAPIPGKGHSSPIISGDRVFVTSCTEENRQRILYCLDRRTGNLAWQRVVLTADLERLHRLNSRASSTPATDGKHVFVTFLAGSRYEVACYDFDGNLIWRQSPGEFHSVHGFCSPPVLYKDTVILNGDQDAVAWIVALDKSTGNERWRTDRPNRTRSYCPPLIVEADASGKGDGTSRSKGPVPFSGAQLVLTGSKCTAGYNPDTGKQLWLVDGPTEQFVASMVFNRGLFFLTAGFPTYHLMAIKPDGTVAWHHNKVNERQAAYVPSPIAHGDWFFVVSDKGYASCLEAATGKRLWFERLGAHHSASPVSVGAFLFFTSDEGDTYVVRAGPTFEVVSKNALDEEVYASAAASHGCLFIRGVHNLYCIGSEKANVKSAR